MVLKVSDGVRSHNLHDDGLGVVECNTHPGYYTVPGFRSYCINSEGVMLSHFTGNPMKPKEKISTTANPIGLYRFFTIVPNNHPKQKNVARHRAVLASHRGFDTNPLRIFVNHKNGIPGDDRLENLEWSTIQENTQHAYDTGLRKDFLIEMESWNVATGEKKIYPSVPEFVRQTGMPVGTIRKRLLRDNAFVYDGFRYRYMRDVWSNTSDIALKELHTNNARETYVLNLRNHKIAKYNSAAHAEIATGINRNIISQNCRKLHMVPLSGYLFRYVDTDFEWPVYSPLQEEYIKYQNYPYDTKNGVAFFDTTGNRIFMGSFAEAETFFNRPLVVIRNYVREGRLINGYRGVYISGAMQFVKDLVKQK